MSNTLSWREKLSYGFANFGINLPFGLTNAFLLYYYTDIYGVDAGLVGTLFLIARGVDAVIDPLIGLMIDRTDSRWGKHRPWLLAVSIPFALCGVLVFWSPDLEGAAKVAFILGSYTLLGALYSAASLPLNSMLATLTRDPRQRNTLNSLREFLGSSGTVGIGYLALPLVAQFGGGDQQRGFFVLSIVLGVITVIGLVNAFINTRERVESYDGGKTLTTRQSIETAKGNWPWVSTMIVNFFFWIGFTAHVQSFIFYAEKLLGDAEFTSNLLLTMMATLAGIAAAGAIANVIGKRQTGTIGALLAMVFTALIPISDNYVWLMAMNTIAYIGLGLIGGLLFSMMADAVDVGEVRTGHRAQGFLFAASSFGVKLGMSIGGAAGAWMLEAADYSPDAPVGAAVKNAIVAGHVWLPTACCAGMMIAIQLFHPEKHLAHPATPTAII